MDFVIIRQYEDNNRIIYRRQWTEAGMKRYFEFDKAKQESTGKEFVSKTQYRAYLKQLI